MTNINKYTCGKIAKSNDLFFTGVIPNYIAIDTLERSINNVLGTTGTTIDNIIKNIGKDSIDQRCLSFDARYDKLRDLYQEEIDKGCDNETKLSTAESDIDFSIGEKLIEVDIDCLLPPEEGCEQNPKTYTFQTILELFVDEVCELKTQIDALSCDNGTSGTSGLSGTSGVCTVC